MPEKSKNQLILELIMAIKRDKNTTGYLDITFNSKWDYIPLTRNYINNFLNQNLTDKLLNNRIQVTVSELMENAIKFANADGIRMVIAIYGEEKKLKLSVFNYTTPKQANILKAIIDDMKHYTPLEYYINCMKTKKKDNKGGKLGLARINHESQAELSMFHNQTEGEIEVTALFGDIK